MAKFTPVAGDDLTTRIHNAAHTLYADMTDVQVREVMYSFLGGRIGWCINGFEPGTNQHKLLHVLYDILKDAKTR